MAPRRPITLFPVLVLLALICTMLPTAAAQQRSDKIDPLLQSRLTAEGRADFLVTFVEQADLAPAYTLDWATRGQFVVDALTAAADRAQGPARSYLDSRGLEHQTFIAGNELYVWSGDLPTAEALATLPEVGTIRAARTYYVDPVLATAPASPEALDWGLVVANIDTGVQWDHPALDQAFKCGTDPTDPACWADPSNICGVGGACDNNGHGTHTMGTMVGDDDPTLTFQVGMAPNAQWIACKGCESASCSDYALNTCADWILSPGGSAANRPHVVNNSWGSGVGCDTWYLGKVNAWRAAGIFPAFSAGNDGPDCYTLGSPGAYQESFATAAHDASRAIASFSSRGSTGGACDPHTPYTKPNISAPGVSICSSVPTNVWSCGYSGTSMASPHSAGAVALLWSCNPGLVGQIDTTFELLQNTANTPPAGSCGAPPDGEGNYTYGYGYLDVLAAGQSGCTSQETWRPGPSVCFDLTRFDAEFFPGTNRVYVLGGRTGADTDGNIYWFDPATGTCGDTGTDMPNPISNYTANLVNDGDRDLLCTFGGRQTDGNQTLNVQCYDPLANNAFVKTDLPAAWTGYMPGAQVVVRNQVYIFGGFGPNTTPYDLARTDRYDPQTDTFMQVGDLSLARSYIMAAAVGDYVYAFGGTTYDGAALTAVTRTEQMYGGTWSNAAVPELPTASAEGQAWGFDTLSTYLYQGQIVLAGGGQWPNQTAAALLYDPYTYSYDETVPDLINARRDHAGVFVPLCTQNPDDGLPGLWVFGGRQGNDDPPYRPAEYLPLPCGLAAPPVCQPFGTQRTTAALPEELRPFGDDPVRGSWSTTDFQVINLAPDTQPFTFNFFSPDGERIYTFGDSLSGGASNYYDPGPVLPFGFTGTLVVETPVRAAMGIVHLEDPPESGGNTVFPGIADETLGNTAYTPIEYCSRLVVHNLHPSAAAHVDWYVLDAGGTLIGGRSDTVPALGTITLDPKILDLPVYFEGSAIVVADQVIEVTVRSDCYGYSAFVAPPYCSTVLYSPQIPENLAAVSVVLQNPNPDYISVAVSYTSGISYTWMMPWSTSVAMPLPGGTGPITIHADKPIVAVVRYASTIPGAEGHDAYRAYAPEEATTALALPVLFADFQHWETDAQISVMNIGPAPANVRIRYVTAPEGQVYWDRATVRPGESGQFARPPQMPAETRAAAIVLADQPILALTTAHNAAPGYLDRQVSYAGTNFPFTYQMATNPAIGYTVTDLTVHFAGTAAGTAPIVYAWDFGDGTQGTGQSANHTYGAMGMYTVVMTATNVWGFGEATTSQVVDLSNPPESWWAYLPIVARSYAGR
jgi:hypothetical protein